PLGDEEVLLASSVGRVMARDLIAEADLPPFDNSAMDGYALWSSDTAGAANDHPVQLRLVGEVAAGSVWDRRLSHGDTVKIMTGAPMPPGADSVVMLEEARLRGDVVEILGSVPIGSHVRPAGEDIRRGTVALEAGTRIRLERLGLLAGLGYARVPVTRRPTVAVLATGSELVDVAEPLAAGKIRNSNGLVLDALLRRVGIEPDDLGTVVDQRDLLGQRLEAAAGHDLLLISGGVSVGEHDLVKRVLCEAGLDTIFWRVNMKPGKPLLFGRWRGQAVFGLPGNPISCVVGFLAFIEPFLWKVMGVASEDRLLQARLTQPLRKQEPKTQWFTARLSEEQGALVVTPTPQQGSGMLTSLAQANAFIVVPEERMRCAAGDVVDVVPLGGDLWP
ncbi:MAG: molybdopterin molybdotransferase MoeA, partial [Candidatus Omnitrophica bacterium]|nr:molybdopterin molybdotransferase MoeA [Candidatus Omnitrophota bacterium]